MNISEDVVSRHIGYWTKELSDGAYGYRSVWPARLFRHEPVENAAKILRSGALLSRQSAAFNEAIVNDIAPTEIIDSNERAYKYARLYFRPRNPTQYHVEGVRKPHEYYKGCHAPVLVVFIFRSKLVLCKDGIMVSDGNMQSPSTTAYSGDDGFNSLPFGSIYHEGPFPPSERDAVIRNRCAEVLVPNKLELRDTLQAVLCRSSAERAFLLYQLGKSAEIWKDRIRVYSRPGVFQSQMSYVEKVQCSSDGVLFGIHSRRDGRAVTTEVCLYDSNGKRLYHYGPAELGTTKTWWIEKKLEDGMYKVKIHLEGCLAYEAISIVDNDPF